MNQIIPIPKIPITVRLATLDDLSFIDALQKKHSKQLGFFPRAQMEGYLKNEWVLIAEEGGSPIGYIAWRDRYQKRDELGAVFQLCVSDSARRKLVGAMLVKSAFERSAYGCRLFCCWCAQDIEANRFWESLGFVPLAFRAGSRARDRVHIFWQRRIRAGDTMTPWWFPSQTSSGAIREDRLVLPIPPGVKWDEAMPIILPKEEGPQLEGRKPKQIEGSKSKSRTVSVKPPSPRSLGGWSFTPPAPLKQKKNAGGTPTPRKKNDPKLIAGARELRDRWLEQVNAGEHQIESNSKYEVCRLPDPSLDRPSPLLIAA